MKTEILQGDCLERMKELPDDSVDCCVTSPPYWGLRDYGTADWEGGDSECDHSYQKGGRNPKTSGKQISNKGTTLTQYENVCKKCGAKRIDKQIGLEETPEEYTERMVEVFREVWRILKPEGTLWLNLGDSYAGGQTRGNSEMSEKQASNKGTGHINGRKTNKHGLKHKDLVGIPWRVAFALQADGWWLRQDIIWHKPNPMPESVTDRCTKAHEYIFLLTKSARYYYDNEAIKEKSTKHPSDWNGERPKRESKKRGDFGGKNQETGKEGFRAIADTRNKRSVWTVTTKPYAEAHFATFPPDLIEPCILAGCPEGGTVFDPFAGSGTTAEVAIKNGRSFLGTELNPEYIKLAEKRIAEAKTGRLPRTVEEVQKTGGQLSILDEL